MSRASGDLRVASRPVPGRFTQRTEWLLAVVAIIACAMVALVVAIRPPPHMAVRAAALATAATTRAPATPVAIATPTVARSAPQPRTIGALSTRGHTVVRAAPNMQAQAVSWIRGGVLMPVIGSKGRFLKV